MSKNHPFSKPVLGQRTSPLLQMKLVELGCDEVFGDVARRVSSILCVQVNESQTYRTCQNIAQAIGEEEIIKPSEPLHKIESDPEEMVYGMVDGSMIFTDDNWQEVKVGRVFKATQIADSEQIKWEMETSQYVAKRGDYRQFVEQFERLLPPQSACKKVFVTDGAAWIHNWVRETYAGAVHILDFFHACERLNEVAPDRKWFEKQKATLLEAGGIALVIKRVKRLVKEKAPGADSLLTYLLNHEGNMQYDYYRQQGWMIGSGPIESAHRTLLQVRMKRSGQRWANHGCDNMIKLRLIIKNSRYDAIRSVLKPAA